MAPKRDLWSDLQKAYKKSHPLEKPVTAQQKANKLWNNAKSENKNFADFQRVIIKLIDSFKQQGTISKSERILRLFSKSSATNKVNNVSKNVSIFFEEMFCKNLYLQFINLCVRFKSRTLKVIITWLLSKLILKIENYHLQAVNMMY